VLAFERAKPSDVRVLIVEDEMLIALGLIDMVEALGASPVAASRLAKALALVADETFDAAIVDMNLASEPPTRFWMRSARATSRSSSPPGMARKPSPRSIGARRDSPSLTCRSMSRRRCSAYLRVRSYALKRVDGVPRRLSATGFVTTALTQRP